MKLANLLSDIAYNRNSVVSVGSFDGMHLAHREILREVVQRARQREGRSVLVTFEPHPREVVGNQTGVPILTSLEEKREIAEACGIDLFYTIKFDFTFSRLSARDFYLNYLVNGIGVSEIVEGYDHHFGRDREGSIREMQSLGKEFGYSSVTVKEFIIDGQVVNSTTIRTFLANGDVEKGRLFLGRPYSIDGVVVKGDMRGRKLGFPTANIDPQSPKKLMPKDGIYFVGARMAGKWRSGLASIGVRPTFGPQGKRTVEVHILDFNDQIYGATLRIAFHKRLRDEIRFENVDQLVQQMKLDKELGIRLQSEYQNAGTN